MPGLGSRAACPLHSWAQAGPGLLDHVDREASRNGAPPKRGGWWKSFPGACQRGASETAGPFIQRGVGLKCHDTTWGLAAGARRVSTFLNKSDGKGI